MLRVDRALRARQRRCQVLQWAGSSERLRCGAQKLRVNLSIIGEQPLAPGLPLMKTPDQSRSLGAASKMRPDQANVECVTLADATRSLTRSKVETPTFQRFELVGIPGCDP